METINIMDTDAGRATTADTDTSTRTSTSTPTWTGTVTKESEDSRVGISFGGDGTQSSPLIIASIRPDGLVAKHTNLCVGLQVLSINGIPIDGYSPNMLAQMVRSAGKGDLTIQAKGVVATCPPPQGRRVGMSLCKDTSLGGNAIVVCRIWPESLLADSPIREGMRLTSINGQPSPSSTRGTIQMILDSQESLKIVAIDNALEGSGFLSTSAGSTGLSSSASSAVTSLTAGGSFASSSCSELPSPPYRMILRSKKSSKNGRCGIGIQKDKETKVIFVKSIEPTSIFKGTPLQPGHIINKINGSPCPRNTRDAVKMIQKFLDNTICLEIFARPDLMDQFNPTTTAETNAGDTTTTPCTADKIEEEDASPTAGDTTTTIPCTADKTNENDEKDASPTAGDTTMPCTVDKTDENDEDDTSPTSGTDEEETVVLEDDHNCSDLMHKSVIAIMGETRVEF